jgi:hypothetical protein
MVVLREVLGRPRVLVDLLLDLGKLLLRHVRRILTISGLSAITRVRQAAVMRRRSSGVLRMLDAVPVRVTGIDVRGPSARAPMAMGALALGAGALGALAIGRLSVGRAKVGRLEIDELEVKRLRVQDLEIVNSAKP